MVYRLFTEKKKEFAVEAANLAGEIKNILGITKLEDLRLLNRYDVEEISEEDYRNSVNTVFSEPQLDDVSENFDARGGKVFAVEYLPGQFDQRADSAAQCIQILTRSARPLVKSAKLYVLYGDLSENDIESIKKFIINPVESREASLSKPDSLTFIYEIPAEVANIKDFRALTRDMAEEFISEYSLAMDADDLIFCRDYFIGINREPTVTELKMIDTYWSDHCRHTTFATQIDKVIFEDKTLTKAWERYLNVRKELNRTSPICLMDIATLAAKYLKNTGKLTDLDESDEINACTIKIKIENDGKPEDWLLLFKNETHNHPTEIEPFGGAATCLGGAIRDPLSGRAYVYAAMRLTGCADPLTDQAQTLKGKLSQRTITTKAAAGYSSYGNQIGLATGIVEELYHPGYVAKRMEIGAVIGAAPCDNVVREIPNSGDNIILLGGKTGRDGCGGATGSSKSHTVSSIETCGAEVQKGNPPEERKIQRLFRNPEASVLIKRCNDFGAGGVSVAIGELADGLDIDLNKVPKKYEGLDGTELAISESQERMAVVVSPENTEKFLALAQSENLEANIVAKVTDNERLIMRLNGKKIVDLDRAFLNSNGASKHIEVKALASESCFAEDDNLNFSEKLTELSNSLNTCSHRGLSDRFDSTIGAASVLMPYGGRYQLTPIQAMAQKIPVIGLKTNDCSLMAFGCNPYILEKSPYHGAYLAVVESVSKVIAVGGDIDNIHLTMQEYFEKLGNDPTRWGKPLSALLGAFDAQLNLGVAAIGGKDSMSGTFEQYDVPPTLACFAVGMSKTDRVVSPEFKQTNSKVVFLAPEIDENNLPKTDSLLAIYKRVAALTKDGRALSVYTPTFGGIGEAIMKMSFGNNIGFCFADGFSQADLFKYCYSSFIIELNENCDIEGAKLLGHTQEEPVITYKNESVGLAKLINNSEAKLESVFPLNAVKSKKGTVTTLSTADATHNKHASSSVAKPKVLIPVFPGTNCEYESSYAFNAAGADAEIFVIRNLTKTAISESVAVFARKLADAQMVFIPGGFSGGDEPEGSAKFITAFFRNSEISWELTNLIEKREGLVCGICNGFQALVKLGLLPYGKIIDTDENCPTLTFNTIGRHQSKIVYTRVCSNDSVWLSETKVGDIHNVAISHGEGRFICSEKLYKELTENKQIATQYVDDDGLATYDIRYNPNGSFMAIEGITSPNGQIIGKMGHSERYSAGIYKNVPGNYDNKMFEAAVKYFK